MKKDYTLRINGKEIVHERPSGLRSGEAILVHDPTRANLKIFLSPEKTIKFLVEKRGVRTNEAIRAVVNCCSNETGSSYISHRNIKYNPTVGIWVQKFESCLRWQN